MITPDAKQTTAAAMALGSAATAVHAMAEIQHAEDALRAALVAADRARDETVLRALDNYHHHVRAALDRYGRTMVTINGATDDDDDDDD